MHILVLKIARIKHNLKWQIKLGWKLMVKKYFRDISQVLFLGRMLESQWIIKDRKNNQTLGQGRKKVIKRMKINHGEAIRNKVISVNFLICLLLVEMKLVILSITSLKDLKEDHLFNQILDPFTSLNSMGLQTQTLNSSWLTIFKI